MGGHILDRQKTRGRERLMDEENDLGEEQKKKSYSDRQGNGMNPGKRGDKEVTSSLHAGARKKRWNRKVG